MMPMGTSISRTSAVNVGARRIQGRRFSAALNIETAMAAYPVTLFTPGPSQNAAGLLGPYCIGVSCCATRRDNRIAAGSDWFALEKPCGPEIRQDAWLRQRLRRDRRSGRRLARAARAPGAGDL